MTGYVENITALCPGYELLFDTTTKSLFSERVKLHTKLLANVNDKKVRLKGNEEHQLLRMHHLNVTLAAMERKSMEPFLQHQLYRNLFLNEEFMSSLKQGKRVANPLYDGTGPYAHIDVSLVDFDMEGKDIFNKQIPPIHQFILSKCKSVCINKNDGKSMVFSATSMNDKRELIRMWNSKGEMVYDPDLLIRGYSTKW